MKKILLLSSLFISFSSFSADVTFNWLNSTSGQNSALFGTCDYLDESNDMVCNLRQIRVSKKLSPEDAIVDICKSPSRDKLLALVTFSAKNVLKTCKVMVYDTRNFQFNQVYDRKWVSTNEPSGQFSAVTILTLEKHPKHDSLWNFSQIRPYTSTESELCKGFAEVNESMSYSWRGNKNLKISCEFIEFGM